MSYELFIARRLRLNPGNRRRPSTSIIIAITGIALSLVIMMAAMCIVLGFKEEIRNKVYGFDAHVTIHPAHADGSPAEFLEYTPVLDSIINSTGCFEKPELVAQQSGILKTDSDFQAIILKGITEDRNYNFIASNITEGSMPGFDADSSRNSIVISQTTASDLGLHPGDKTYAYFFSNGAVKTRRLNIAAIYDTHFSDYDKIYAYSPISLTQGIGGTDSAAATTVELTSRDPSRITESGIRLQDAMMTSAYMNRLTGAYTLTTVLDTAMMYFNWLELLDTNVVVILILMIAVSGFTLVSCLFILILERVRMIGILKTLGASNSEIRKIFIYLSQRIVLWGMLAGNVIGISFIILQHHLHILPLDADAYYLNYVPVKIDWMYIILLNFGIFLVSWLIIILPTHMVAKINPCKSIRYE
ncbi:ABC transporter permease [Barnesiella sp. WM24]|uniref:ABC transporter permease n=1 Tax=Barnesiella sp. WM24 TaxID=2558278 RepID=UPI0010724D76|nr:FtsX-like permease family protein [Barnesiella sp. WM24]TFU92675.1 ABC transporter permease [Barnesiella sp. WM24]